MEVSTTSNFASTLSGYSGLTSTNVVVGPLSINPNTTYYYRVKAFNGSGSSGYSNVITLTTVNFNASIQVPSISSISAITGTSFTVNWTPISGITTYLLDVSSTNYFTVFEGNYHDLPVTGTSVSVSGLATGVTYYVRIRSYQTGATSNYSTTSTALTTVSIVPPTLTAATNIKAKAVTLNWTPVSGNVGYELDVSKFSTFTPLLSGLSSKVVSGSSTTIDGLSPATQYYYRMRTLFNGSVESTNSATGTVITATLTPEILDASEHSDKFIYGKLECSSRRCLVPIGCINIKPFWKLCVRLQWCNH